MKLIKMWTSDERYEWIVASTVESVMLPSGRVHDNGAVRLKSGRIIAFGNQSGAEEFAKELRNSDYKDNEQGLGQTQ